MLYLISFCWPYLLIALAIGIATGWFSNASSAVK
jgi:hypothetical protein